MANSYTLTEIADLCHNEIRLIGTLTEFAADAYVKNDVGVIKYKGVVNCNNAFINIKATTTSFDDTFAPFINEFNTDVIGRKVFIMGALNATGGINVNYIALAYKDDYFEGKIRGIPYEGNNILIVDNEYHSIVNLNVDKSYHQDYICEYKLGVNSLEVDSDGTLLDDGMPSIEWIEFQATEEIEGMGVLVNQALEEHEIYLEAMRQIKEGI